MLMSTAYLQTRWIMNNWLLCTSSNKAQNNKEKFLIAFWHLNSEKMVASTKFWVANLKAGSECTCNTTNLALLWCTMYGVTAWNSALAFKSNHVCKVCVKRWMCLMSTEFVYASFLFFMEVEVKLDSVMYFWPQLI